MYSFADRVLIYGNCILDSIVSFELIAVVAPKLRLPVNPTAVNSVTRGLIGDTSFGVLPDVSPKATFAMTLTFQVVRILKIFLNFEINGL